jgi:hypothetical protein
MGGSNLDYINKAKAVSSKWESQVVFSKLCHPNVECRFGFVNATFPI